jgi:hypothetical protein
MPLVLVIGASLLFALELLNLLLLPLDLALLLFKLALLLGLLGLLALHLVTNQGTRPSTERRANCRTSTRASDCRPNDRASSASQKATSQSAFLTRA